jgi:hypothetical protein
MQRERQKASLLPLAAPPPRTGFEDPADLTRLTPIIRAAQEGAPAAIDTLLTGLASPLLHAVRALMGPRNPDVEDLVQEVLIAVIDALPSCRGEYASPLRDPHRARRDSRAPQIRSAGWLELFGAAAPLSAEPVSPRDGRSRSPPHSANVAGQASRAQAEAMVLRLASASSKNAAISSADRTVRSRLRLAKDAHVSSKQTRDGQSCGDES